MPFFYLLRFLSLPRQRPAADACDRKRSGAGVNNAIDPHEAPKAAKMYDLRDKNDIFVDLRRALLHPLPCPPIELCL
jgi:hypothetical protein